VTEIGEWLWSASGFSRLLILNGHFTNFAPLRCALEALRYKNPKMRIALKAIWDISPRVRAEYFADGDDWHANAAETSIMMALFPEGVREEKFADDPDRTGDLLFAYPVDRTSKNGATGLITQADAANGHKIFEWAVEDLSAQVLKALSEEPPFPSHLDSNDQGKR
jgi:creatinine amidohydrolase